MISTSLYFLPFISAFIGWLLGRLAVGVFFKQLQVQKSTIASSIGNHISKSFSLDELASQLGSAESIEKILPFAEEHIDQFLRVKLPAAMPMLSMFISDKLVADMKAIFMTELKELFPALISQYVTNAKETFKIEEVITAKIAAVDFNSIRVAMSSKLNGFAYAGAAIGFITGLIQIFLTLLA